MQQIFHFRSCPRQDNRHDRAGHSRGHSMILQALGFLAALLSPVATLSAAEDTPDYADFDQGLFMPYLDAHEGDLKKPPRLGLSFGGDMIEAVMDSGSTGIVVAARYVPGWEAMQSLGEGRITYTSSGRIMIGQWVVTPVSIQGADGRGIETSPMPILVVTQVACTEMARDCTPSDDPAHIAMLGVGFGREHDAQAQSTPDKNPFLQVKPRDEDRYRRGYILTAKGVHVGLTRANTDGDFRFVKLKRQQETDDWSAVPACISVDGQMPPACGTMLADTGVTAMFMTLPAEQAGSNTRSLQPGTSVSILLGSGDQAGELYSFEVGDDSSSLAPSEVHLRVAPDRVFVNTSLHILNGFDFLYDADGGYAGFRSRRD